HFWTLSVEEQFYVFWPFVIILIPRQKLVVTLVILVLSAPLYRLICSWFGLNQVATWVLPPNSFDALGLGALLAVLIKGNDSILLRLPYIVPPALFLWILSVWHPLPQWLVTTGLTDTA